MSIETDAIKAQVVSEVIQRITALDQEQRYEDSYALTQDSESGCLTHRFNRARGRPGHKRYGRGHVASHPCTSPRSNPWV